VLQALAAVEALGDDALAAGPRAARARLEALRVAWDLFRIPLVHRRTRRHDPTS
jgi:hypothetical protein